MESKASMLYQKEREKQRKQNKIKSTKNTLTHHIAHIAIDSNLFYIEQMQLIQIILLKLQPTAWS